MTPLVVGGLDGTNVGAQLRQAREGRGLSIATVAARTRIQPQWLDALERNDLSVVPPHPYSRGFVAAFAREVGLDADQTVRDYFAQFEEIRGPETTAKASPLDGESDLRRWSPALVGLTVVLMVWLFLTNRTDLPQASDPGVVGTSGAGAGTGRSVASAGQKVTGAAPARRDVERPADVHLLSGLVVVLEADGPAWIAATVDGQRQVYQMVSAGATFTLRGSHEIAIRVGDAGAVRWSVNGRPATVMGAPAQVRNVRVTSQDTRR